MSSPGRYPMTAPALARELGLDPKRLRHVIRRYELVPSHRHNDRYELDAEDVARIKAHPAVAQAIGSRPRR
jgi:hypothetical protein